MISAAAYIVLTVLIYWTVKRVYRWKKLFVLSPLLIVPVVIICILAFGHISFDTYNEGGRWLTGMIGPATLALAVPLYKNFSMLKKHALEIVTAVAAGSGAGFLTALGIAHLFHLSKPLVAGLLLRSTTTPIAIAVSDRIGGISSVTAVIVLLTGLLGMSVGPVMIRKLHIRSEIAQGVMMGTSAHTAGTYKAFELSGLSGAISTICMILSAFITLLCMPLFVM
ncbi:LrgB family protein [Paenibacillus thalictri]|uniref:LrgB family protein n=1 Tax=Paenibacillus thalictri TaxID=2527873 RepID=A0A4Q9DVK3_9BACL|nr:LrgB family protein [Paenibacillus thalictri]TBL79823.1 LrgB family protein [Paenibacillus thalictri]